MAYAELSDLKARAGVIAQAWGDNTQPKDADLERILQQVASELDMFIGGAGYSVPLQDPVAIAALVAINADKALLVAIDGTYPGDKSNVTELRSSVKARVEAYDKAIASGDAAILLYLGQTASGQFEGGATDFWTLDGWSDYYWSVYGYEWPYGGDQFGNAPTQRPFFRKGMAL